MTIHLTPRLSLFLFVVFVAAAAQLVGGCANRGDNDATNFWANMESKGVGKL